jgi:hypothetical protein
MMEMSGSVIEYSDGLRSIFHDLLLASGYSHQRL